MTAERSVLASPFRIRYGAVRVLHSEANTAALVEAPIDRDVRALLFFLIPWAAACLLVFLAVSDFFASWQGQVVSARPATSEDPAVYQVLVVGDEGSREVTWPAEVVRPLGLPVDPLALPPVRIPPERPQTSKLRFQLHFLVQDPADPEGGTWQTVPTTSPRGLGLAVVVFLLGLGVRNMIRSGSPASIKERDAYLPPEQASAGTPAPRSQGRPQKRPPPGKPKRGPRR